MNGMQRVSQTFHRLAGEFFSLPRFLRFGVVVFVVSGALDLSYHVFSAFRPGVLDRYFGPDGYYAHLALFTGMVLVVTGVIRAGARLRRTENSQINTIERGPSA